MDRRRFLVTSLAGAFVAPLGAESQETAKVARIGFLTTTSQGDSPTTDAFRQGLSERG
jgi:hypothetical protein